MISRPGLSGLPGSSGPFSGLPGVSGCGGMGVFGVVLTRATWRAGARRPSGDRSTAVRHPSRARSAAGDQPFARASVAIGTTLDTGFWRSPAMRPGSTRTGTGGSSS